MPPILPSGRYIISIARDTETYCVGTLADNSGAVGIFPGHVDSPQIYTLYNVDGVDEYNISINGQSVGEKEDGELCLERPDLDDKKRWKIVPKGDDKYVIKDGEKACWSFASFPPQNPVGFPIANVKKCRTCVKGCKCTAKDTPLHCGCLTQGCRGCGATTNNPRIRSLQVSGFSVEPDNGCSGCPSPCCLFQITPVTE
ncbi:hypothetical protein OG21DRAFT_1517909 [Imleria badia]|nr:hypothetical protein OG21DRAFT_1517909 [Imleria badia]